ncbi:DUF4142 domain-containing protein [Allokutzneria albata]|uniref:Predicted outer membrane protein n=1 Tax=Allokutzneria albata TaxID=211114 RepID=A0A1G9YSF3_ALLAB|nr:DUF4142 domain-containing protein [Allokutzneria albata]SDN11575.1 Predicted outer membrane protein [Allokutzneria albata]
MRLLALIALLLGFCLCGNALATAQALEPSDRELLEKVRLAGLWEIPTGHQAAERGESERVRDVGKHIAEDHVVLDDDVRRVAEQLGVPLPDRPNADQQAWMAEIASKTGSEYDRTFANRLRAAHGTVFGLVAKVRSGTRNDAVRAFAQRAVNAVMRHMTLLESTGLVQADSLAVQAKASTTRNSISAGHLLSSVLLGLIAAGLTLGLIRNFSTSEG